MKAERKSSPAVKQAAEFIRRAIAIKAKKSVVPNKNHTPTVALVAAELGDREDQR